MKLWGAIKSNIISECVIGPFEIPNQTHLLWFHFWSRLPPSTTHWRRDEQRLPGLIFYLLLLIIMQYVLLLALKRRIWKVVVLWRRRRPCWTWGLSLLLLINNNADNDDPAHPSILPIPIPIHRSCFIHKIIICLSFGPAVCSVCGVYSCCWSKNCWASARLASADGWFCWFWFDLCNVDSMVFNFYRLSL